MKFFKLAAIALASLLAISVSAAAKPVTLKVGATPVPHVGILEVVKPILAKENINLEIIEFTDYVQPNLALASGELDANFFQHVPYLQDFSDSHKLNLTYIAKVHIEPIGAYSKKIKSVSALKKGAQVAIPNDPTNGGRALLLLQDNNLIKLKKGTGIKATVMDIAENPKGLKFVELEAAQLPRSLDDVDMAIINTNFALEAKLDPSKDALFREDGRSPYANILAVRNQDKNDPNLKKLAEALNSKEVKDYINKKFKGDILPAF